MLNLANDTLSRAAHLVFSQDFKAEFAFAPAAKGSKPTARISYSLTNGVACLVPVSDASEAHDNAIKALSRLKYLLQENRIGKDEGKGGKTPQGYIDDVTETVGTMFQTPEFLRACDSLIKAAIVTKPQNIFKFVLINRDGAKQNVRVTVAEIPGLQAWAQASSITVVNTEEAELREKIEAKDREASELAKRLELIRKATGSATASN